MLGQYRDDLHLLLDGQASDSGLDDASDGCLVYSNKARVVHESDGAHDELAVHPVSHTTVARNRVAEVLDLEGSLESGSEEASKWSDQ